MRPAGDGPTGDGNPNQLALVVGSAHGELAADRGEVVPVAAGHELIGCFQV
jgi:hypothetical protein